MREFIDAEGRSWLAFVQEDIVAHGRRGSRLAFRAAGHPTSEPVLSTINFNSLDAGEWAVRTMSEKELKRRLALAMASARPDEHTLPPT
jgi:hypothetical protein